eukprot:SM000408S15242  [mRNA]  locus=s408:39412:41276:+ [translate_table: standard]
MGLQDILPLVNLGIQGVNLASQGAYWMKEWWTSNERTGFAHNSQAQAAPRDLRTPEEYLILEGRANRISKLLEIRAASIEIRANMEKELQDVKDELKKAEEAAKNVRQLLIQYRQRVAEAERHAIEARKKWKKAIDHKGHLSQPLEDLQHLQAQLRASLPPCDPTWRHVVIIGPSGLGKTSFVRQMLEELHYEGCMDGDELRTSSSCAGTLEQHEYFLDNHKLVLIDCVGSVRSNFANGIILAANLVIMFLSENCRAEEPHGEAVALAYRLRASMQCAFILPKMDNWIRNWRPGQEVSSLPNGEVVLACAHNDMAKDLILKLDQGVEESIESFSIEIAPDLQVFLDMAEDAKIEHLNKFVGLRCFFSTTNYDIGHSRFPRSLPAVLQEAMADERQALVDLICKH